MPVGLSIDSFVKLIFDRKSVQSAKVIAFLEEVAHTTQELRGVWAKIYLELRAHRVVPDILLSDLSRNFTGIDDPKSKELFQFIDADKASNIRWTTSTDAFYKSLTKTLGGRIPEDELSDISECVGNILFQRRWLRAMLDKLYNGDTFRTPNDKELAMMEKHLEWLTQHTARLDVLIKSLKVSL
jgi:hypothetical protein